MAGLARVGVRIGELELAARLIAAIQAIVAEDHIVLEPTDGSSLDDGLAIARAELDGAAFDAAWEHGSHLNFDAAIALAYAVEDRVKALQDRSMAAGLSPTDLLSPREREVAALLPQGWTNRQIAEALTITEGTANLHVKHILAKLGFTSRAQVAAWAVEQRLSNAQS
jgi:non-specific serine/threonine protein kinase